MESTAERVQRAVDTAFAATAALAEAQAQLNAAAQRAAAALKDFGDALADAGLVKLGNHALVKIEDLSPEQRARVQAMTTKER